MIKLVVVIIFLIYLDLILINEILSNGDAVYLELLKDISSTHEETNHHHKQQQSHHSNGYTREKKWNTDSKSSLSNQPIRVLHIVTSLSENRLNSTTLPLLQHSIHTMIEPPYNFEVDVYLILGWKLKPCDYKRILENYNHTILPPGVGLQIWDDATPIAYDNPRKDSTIRPITRSLARQHRFVIKDKLMYYDLFSVFEDDMMITGRHLNYFWRMSQELKLLQEEAENGKALNELKEIVGGKLTKKQISAMVPGFIRAEVLLDESKWPSQKELASIEVDLEFEMKDGSFQNKTFDPLPCCYVPNNLVNLPSKPSFDQIMIWETSIKGTSIRKMPTNGGSGLIDWVMLQQGPNNRRSSSWTEGYWSSSVKTKPHWGDPQLFAQQGGWMLTREQLIEFHHNHCNSGFFPPYEGTFHQDGLTADNVEFWSGGFSIFSNNKSGCNIRRIINIDPDQFSNHFLYHTSNNKQKSLQHQNYRLLKANNFLGQINSIAKEANRVNELAETPSHVK